MAISVHDVEFWEVETQNFNFLKKMKTDSKANFHPTTFKCSELARASAGSVPRYAIFFGALLILFSFSCQFDLAFWAFLAPFAVEVGRWEGHGAGVLLLAMVPRL